MLHAQLATVLAASRDCNGAAMEHARAVETLPDEVAGIPKLILDVATKVTALCGPTVIAPIAVPDGTVLPVP